MTRSQRTPTTLAAFAVLASLTLFVANAVKAQPIGTAPVVGRLEIAGLAPSGDMIENAQVEIVEEPYGRLAPLLPYIFFDEGSSSVPARYLDSDSATGSLASGDPFVRAYRGIVRVVASRLAASGETVRLVGTCSPGEPPAVARARAQAVAEALVVRGVRRDRIEIGSGGVPQNPSNNARPEGRAENRRVEIFGSAALLAPMWLPDTLARISSPGIRIVPEVVARRGLASWAIELQYDGKLFRRLSGSAPPPPMIDDSFGADELRWIAATNGRAIDARMVVRDSTGDSAVSATSRILIMRKREVRQIDPRRERAQDREGIVLFGFDSSDPLPGSTALLEDLLSRVAADEVVSITGYTDETGDSRHNQELSERRAEAVARMLGARTGNVRGAGESGGLHWNLTPEDRFYSRVARLAAGQR